MCGIRVRGRPIAAMALALRIRIRIRCFTRVRFDVGLGVVRNSFSSAMKVSKDVGLHTAWAMAVVLFTRFFAAYACQCVMAICSRRSLLSRGLELCSQSFDGLRPFALGLFLFGDSSVEDFFQEHTVLRQKAIFAEASAKCSLGFVLPLELRDFGPQLVVSGHVA